MSPAEFTFGANSVSLIAFVFHVLLHPGSVGIVWDWVVEGIRVERAEGPKEFSGWGLIVELDDTFFSERINSGE